MKKQDLWNLDKTISIFILKHLIAFRKMKRFGYPPELKGMAEWNKILDKMIFAFENDTKYEDGRDQFVLQQPKYGYCEVGSKETVDFLDVEPKKLYHLVQIKKEILNTRGWRSHQKKVKEGLDLFWRYRKSLWD